MTDDKMDDIHLGGESDDDNTEAVTSTDNAKKGDTAETSKSAETEEASEEPQDSEATNTAEIDAPRDNGEEPTAKDKRPETSESSAEAPPLHKTSTSIPPKGATSTVNDITFYTSGEAKNADTLIVVLTNYLGFQSNNNLLCADSIHETTGLPVVLVDSTGNNPAMHVMRLKGDEELPHLPPPQTKPKSQSGPSFLGKFKSWFAGSVSGFFDDMWLAAHSYEKTINIVRSSIETVYQVYTPGQIIVVGYGFGARYVLPLLKRSSLFNPHEEDDEDSSPWEVRDKANAEDHILAGVAINPSLTTEDDFKNVYKPLLFIYSDDNEMLPRSTVEQGFRAIPGKDAERKAISQNPPLPHGFAIPGDYSEDVVGEKPKEVFEMIDKWVKAQLTKE
ncbi:hypothetical protein CJU90_5156 [Yarrowia sp. C11]|nr:hypothetical protein CJU90_5156 [Yarrowia sp. C11]KAG5364955.1 hypothetical protein CKK34_3784 [Yarrowia sp. E02]